MTLCAQRPGRHPRYACSGLDGLVAGFGRGCRRQPDAHRRIGQRGGLLLHGTQSRHHRLEALADHGGAAHDPGDDHRFIPVDLKSQIGWY